MKEVLNKDYLESNSSPHVSHELPESFDVA